MLNDLLKTILGTLPRSVRYCERDGTFCDAGSRAEYLRARAEQLRATVVSGI